ncbi:hypothetical protein HYX09_02430 [Candidatus Woesearchaeota archaeon]|nr:hypothetical protein [Candidatus Woesearchaeota archaeon]MBI2661104.1 hypothetical protein [Candidatus Woesearchaeota archaeon]
MGQLEPFLGTELGFKESILDKELIERNHKAAEMLSKKGYKVKVPSWNYPIAS